MEAYFTSLTKRQTMLLLTAVTFGGQESPEAFEHLPEAEADLLKHRAQAILQLPREQRIPMLVAEMKRLVSSKKGLLWSVDPVRLGEVLKRERPALVDVLLRALPESLAAAIRVYLPPQKSRARREIKPAVLSVVRWKLDEILQRYAPLRPTFRFSDVKYLYGRELLTLSDRLGLKALAPALAGLDDEARETFIEALSPELHAPAQAAVEAAAGRKLLPADAAEILSLHQDSGSPMDAVRSAGAQRLIRAAMAQGLDFATSLVERHHAALPPAFIRWFKEERTRTIERGDGGRTEIVVELERLAERRLVEPPLRVPKAAPRSGSAAKSRSSAAASMGSKPPHALAKQQPEPLRPPAPRSRGERPSLPGTPPPRRFDPEISKVQTEASGPVSGLTRKESPHRPRSNPPPPKPQKPGRGGRGGTR